MSGFMFGGSALNVDIGVRNGTHTGGAGALSPTTFVPGDWVAISAQPNSDGGYEAVLVTCTTGSAAAAAQCVMPVGVVLGPAGMSYRPGTAVGADDGAEFLVRIKGTATAKVTAGGALTAPLPLSRVTNQLHSAVTTNTDFLGQETHERVWSIMGCGVLIGNHSGAAAVEQCQVYVTNNRI